jgi:hypothetical protein
VCQRIIHISVAIGTGENNYTEFHGGKDSLKIVVGDVNQMPAEGMNFLFSITKDLANQVKRIWKKRN